MALAAVFAVSPAAAQNWEPAAFTSPWKADAVAAAPAPLGFEPAPGVTFVPSAFSEIGYDSNPSQTFADAKGSAFTRSGAGFVLSSVSERVVSDVSAGGSMMDYLNGTELGDPLRFAGFAKGSLTYLVQPGVTVSSAAFIDYDGQSVNRNQTDGANAELAFRDQAVSSFLRVKFFDVQYLNSLPVDVPVSPISLNSAFNYNRSEVKWGGLYGNNLLLAPYGEAAAARVQYTDQPDPALIDRSADDYYAKAGLRWAVSPVLSADLGWRFNTRDTDDRRVTSFNSNGFDGSLSWRPSPFFQLSASADRTIGEPSSAFGILADVRSYSVKAAYLPVPGVTVSAAGGWQAVRDIGSGVEYRAPFANALVSWAYNNRVQLYTALQYQGYNLEWQSLSYNDVRVTAGVRIVPDGQDLLNGESLESLAARLADARRPANADLTVSAGSSWFALPDMKMVTVVGGPFFDQALGQETNGSGNLNGWRTDARLANFAEGRLPDETPASFGVSGFFANYQGTTQSHCMYSLTTDCAIVNIVDFDPNNENNTGPFGNLHVKASRDVDYYGVAIDARLGDLAGGGLKDGPLAGALSPFKLGVAVRGLNESASLTSIDPLVSVPVKYRESLNTYYYGGFAGIEKKAAFGDGWVAAIDATAGVYYASTDYQGRYNGYSVAFQSGYVQESGSINSSLDTPAFIGTLRLDLKRQLGWGAIGAFGEGEYLSYVPRIAYNNNDQAGGPPWGIAGTQIGTRILSSSAFNVTGGLSVSVPVN